MLSGRWERDGIGWPRQEAREARRAKIARAWAKYLKSQHFYLKLQQMTKVPAKSSVMIVGLVVSCEQTEPCMGITISMFASTRLRGLRQVWVWWRLISEIHDAGGLNICSDR